MTHFIKDYTCSKAELTEFFRFVNTNDYNLKFTVDYDANTMHFLDISLYRSSNGLSFHPPALKKSLPLSQFTISYNQTFKNNVLR